MKKIIFASVIAGSVLMAGGYKIPELSLNAVALSSANVAHTTGADAAYYNPANMIFMKDENSFELSLTYIGLNAVNYNGTHRSSLSGVTTSYNIDSEAEAFIVPSVHYVSKKIGNARIGFSMVSPVGLSKRWQDQPAQASSEEFSLQTVELNPTVALPIGDDMAVAVGARMVYSKGIVKAYAPAVLKQDMQGDSIDFGYNLAFAYKPTKSLNIGATYRSQIDLTEEGDADLFFVGGTFASGTLPAVAQRNYEASVTIPLPAALNLAIAYTLPTNTTIEFVYERTYWSAYKELQFKYNDPDANAVFGTITAKDWIDTNAFRFGITQPLGDTTIMAGIVFDETPIPNTTVGFDLPDSNSISVSLGGRHLINNSFDLGLAVLYSIREDREVSNDTLKGKFSNSNALLVSVGAGYKF